jgi:hypothetical protein
MRQWQVKPRRAGQLGVMAAVALAMQLPAAPTLAVPMSGDRRAVQPGAFPATGFVRCAGGTGTAQLVGSAQVIVTAGHVLIGRGGKGDGCSVTFGSGSAVRQIAIDMAQVRSGSANPLSAPAAQDWAVARLVEPLSGVRPLSTASAALGQQVRLVSGRTLPGGGGPTVEPCVIRGRTPRQAELAIDCSAQAGDSGAALLTSDGRLAAIYVGFRTMTPGRSAPYSDTHYNFALPISGAISAAVRELSR